MTSPPSAGVPGTRPLRRLEIFVDGSNFLPSLREAGIRFTVDIPLLARRLAAGYLLVKMRYYTAPHPDFGSGSYRAQQRFFDVLRAAHSVELVLGRHEPRWDRYGHKYYKEKETDVNLAVDLVFGAHRDRYDVAMLIAGDTDYVRAVQAAQEVGKEVIWGHLSTQTHSQELLQVCEAGRLLDEKFLRTCTFTGRRQGRSS